MVKAVSEGLYEEMKFVQTSVKGGNKPDKTLLNVPCTAYVKSKGSEIAGLLVYSVCGKAFRVTGL